MRPSVSPRPHLPASAVYPQSVSGLSWSAGHAAGISSSAGGRSPASRSATRHVGSSDRRAAMTAPADPPPTTTKSKCLVMQMTPWFMRRPSRPRRSSRSGDNGAVAVRRRFPLRCSPQPNRNAELTPRGSDLTRTPLRVTSRFNHGFRSVFGSEEAARTATGRPAPGSKVASSW